MSSGDMEQKSIHMRDNIGQGYLCLKVIDLSFNKVYYLGTVLCVILNISNKPCQCRTTDYWVDDTLKD